MTTPKQASKLAIPPPPQPKPKPQPQPQPSEPEAAERRITNLSCPNCGGALEVADGLRVAHCPYCDTPLLALGELGVRRFSIQSKISASQAQETTRRWWRGGFNKDRRLAKKAETAETFLCFLPFFRTEADVLGVALGTERRTRTVGSGKNRRTETYYVDVEKQTQRHFDRTFPAVNVAEWGVRKINLGGDLLRPFDSEALAREGMVFPPTVSEAPVRQAALRFFRRTANPARGQAKTRFRFLETVRERFSVIYYPLWVVRYRFRGRSYQALIDGEDGQLAYGKAPGNDLYRALALVGSEALACFVATTILQYSVFHLSLSDFTDNAVVPTVIGILLLSCLGLVAWGWERFRYGGVVEEGESLHAEIDVPKSIRTMLEQGSPPPAAEGQRP